MKKFIWLLTRPFYWLWKILSSGLSLLSNLIFLSLIIVIVTASFYVPNVTVPNGCALILAPEGDIVEERSPMDPVSKIINQVTDSSLHSETFLQDVLDAVHAAAQDPRIKLLVINTNRMEGASLDQIQAIGEALGQFKDEGKQIIAIGDSFNQAQYYLASWADKIYLHPMGTVNLRGFSVYRLYLKEMLDKLAVDFHVFRVGTFKSAVEPFLRNDMSPEDREANSLWLNKLWSLYSADIVKHRRLLPEVFAENVNQMVSQLASVGGDRAQLALATGLVDGLKTRQELEAMFLNQVGPAEDTKSFNHIDFQSYLQTITPSYTEPKDQQGLIGIITARGNILPGEGSVGQIGADDLIKKIRKARQDKRIKAIVLRINTGGGSAFASELIRQELVQAKKEGKVVVVSMGAMTASGGYWLAADADSIVAAPTTLTGSIGIFGAIPTLEKSLAKLGIHGDGIGTTEVALFGNMTNAMSTEEASAFQMDVEQGYKQFIGIVAQGRKMQPAAVEKIAEGRVWDGTTAQQLGLVDKLGTLETAIAEAARLAQVSPENGFFIDMDPENLLERFKRAEQPVEALVGRCIQAPLVPASLQRAVGAQLDLFIPKEDPRNMYAHSMLPRAPLNLR
ncbi:MAG: signal peptide peptidase SppA [Desulfobulbus sp.]|nr:signal peptide peptidase SppA [Desulfobulbus sp.]